MNTGIVELVLIVGDVRAAARFYEEVVGLVAEVSADETWAWFWSGEPGFSPRLALHKGKLLFEEHSPFPEGERWGPVHFALHVERSDLKRRCDHVKSHGLEVHGPTRLEWMMADSFYFFDPDGHLVEFWSPDPNAD